MKTCSPPASIRNQDVVNEDPISTRSSSSSSQQDTAILVFSDIQNCTRQSTLCDPKYWSIVTDTPQKIELCAITPDHRDGARVVKSISLSSSLKWNATIHNIDVSQQLLANQEIVSSRQVVTNILKVFEKLHFCCGQTNSSYNRLPDFVFNVKREILGKTESCCIGGQPPINIKRALGCFGVDVGGGRVCAACRDMRNTLDVSLSRMKQHVTNEKNDSSSSSSKSNWRFLGEAERSKRESDERRCRVNAERRENYAKRKTSEEKKLKQITSADNEDIVAIFREVDQGCDEDGNEILFPDDPNASFFWSFQRELIEAKKPKWHPR